MVRALRQILRSSSIAGESGHVVASSGYILMEELIRDFAAVVAAIIEVADRHHRDRHGAYMIPCARLCSRGQQD
jgi:hypothetical protein